MNDFDKYQAEIDAMSLTDLFYALGIINKEYGKAWKTKYDLCELDTVDSVTEIKLEYYSRKYKMLEEKINQKAESIGIQIL